MRKATLVLATSVAFLVSGAAFAATGTRTATPSSAADLFKNGTIVDAAGNLRVESKPISGVYIPAGAAASTEVAVPVKTVATVAKSAIPQAIKGAIRANAAAAAASAAINAAVAGVGWVMENSQVQKKGPETSVDYDSSSGYFAWRAGDAQGYGPFSTATSPDAASKMYFDKNYSGHVKSYDGCKLNGSVAYCTATVKTPSFTDPYQVTSVTGRIGKGCPSGSNYSNGTGTCVTSGMTAVTDQDYNDLGDWIKQQDGTYVRQVAIDSCSLAVLPDACFDSLVSQKSITGPSVVTGKPVTTSTTTTVTSPSGTSTTGVSTTTTTPAATVTYNSNETNNITYNTYNQTSTKNPDGSTTETTSDEGAPPNVPDLTSTAFGPLDGLPGDILDTKSQGSSLPFASWFSMGGQCREHTFQLPVVGALSTSYCPIHEAYVRPFLYFIFSVWTFIYCFQIWRESTVRVRIM